MVAFVPAPKNRAPSGPSDAKEPNCVDPAAFDKMCSALVELFGQAESLHLPKDVRTGRRGKFTAINFGLTSGTGTKVRFCPTSDIVSLMTCRPRSNVTHLRAGRTS